MKETMNESESCKKLPWMTTIQERWEKEKRKLASFLQKQSERLSPDTKRIVLALSGIVMGGLCLLLILRPIAVSHKTGSYLDVNPTGVAPIPKMNEPPVSKVEYRMLLDFIRAMDSLRQRDVPFYKEIMEGREGLLDTLRLLLELHK